MAGAFVSCRCGATFAGYSHHGFLEWYRWPELAREARALGWTGVGDLPRVCPDCTEEFERFREVRNYGLKGLRKAIAARLKKQPPQADA